MFETPPREEPEHLPLLSGNLPVAAQRLFRHRPFSFCKRGVSVTGAPNVS